jgi:outer membrane protein assembly factor BamB
MKIAIIMILVLFTTLACSFTGLLPNTTPSSTGSNQPTQVLSPNTQDVTSEVSKWNISISTTIPKNFPPSNINPLKNPFWEDSLIISTQNTNLVYQSYYIDNDVVYFSNENQQPTAINLTSGNKIWQSDIQGFILGLGNNVVLVYRDDNRIYGLNKQDGKNQWMINVTALVSEEKTLKPFPFVIPSQGDITIPMMSSCKAYSEWNIRFLHVDELNGDTKLTDCDATPNIDTPFEYSNGLVIAEDLSSAFGSWCTQGTLSISGLDPVSGTEKWGLSNGNGCLFILQTDTQNGLMYVEFPQGDLLSETSTDLVAIDTKTGGNVWGDGLLAKNGVPGTEPFSGKFTLTEKYVYFVTANEIFVFQKDNGILISQFPQERKFNAFFSENGNIVISYPSLGTSKGIDPVSSQEIWNNDELVLTDNLTTIGDVLIFTNDANEVLGLNQKSGQVLWKEVIEGYPYNSTIDYSNIYIKFYANNFTIFGNIILYKDAQNSRVYLLDPVSGDNRIIIDTPLNTRTIRPIHNNLWLVEFVGQLSLVSLK